MCKSSSVLPLTFFQLPLQSWLQIDATGVVVILNLQLPWKIYFPFLCWHLRLARNERIFHNQSSSQNQLIYKMIQATIEFFYLVGPDKSVQSKIHQSIVWMAPANPFIMLNMDGSSLSNPGRAEAGGLQRGSSGKWISGFSLNLGITSNNVAELGAVR